MPVATMRAVATELSDWDGDPIFEEPYFCFGAPQSEFVLSIGLSHRSELTYA